MKFLYLLLLSCAVFFGCKEKDENQQTQPQTIVTNVPTITSDICWHIYTDKALYSPGEEVHFTTDGTPTEQTFIRYRNASQVLSDEPLLTNTWSWIAPNEDGCGYMVEVYRLQSDFSQRIIGTIAVDVSSDWSMYPRYGFVGTYDESKTDEVIAQETAFLNRCHINGIQFYDWHWKHHRPLAGTKEAPMDKWQDIAKRTILKKVVENYIQAFHSYNIKAMFYNLCYGALDDAGAREEGVKLEWYAYKDKNHADFDKMDFDNNWVSDIYLLNSGNEDWQTYLAKRNDDVYSVFDFDGFHIDQLGDWGQHYTYDGQPIAYPQAYASFINAMKKHHPDKRLVMNAVSSFGSQAICQTGNVDFAYNELWASEDKFTDIYSVIKGTQVYSQGKLKSILAAYMNYECDQRQFNAPGVLLTDAVIFALGGAHLELGDHMLCREYFPYTGVTMSPDLKDKMICYYDFMTAYETLLRGGGEEEILMVSAEKKGSKVNVAAWPPKLKYLTTFARKQGQRHILHILNFSNADQLSWRDLKGTMPTPKTFTDLVLNVSIKDAIQHVYVASPDYHGGALVELPFEQKNGIVNFTLPGLKYWDMIVFE